MIDERDEIERMRLEATLLHAPKKIVVTVKRLVSPSSGIILKSPPHRTGRALMIDLDSIKQREAFNERGRIEFTTVNWFDVNGEDRGWIPADVFFL